MVEMTQSKVLGGMTAEIIKVQRVEFNKGNTENSGASIDAMVVIQKLISHPRYRGNAAAAAVANEINTVFGDALKHAKPLVKQAQTIAYHVVRTALTA